MSPNPRTDAADLVVIQKMDAVRKDLLEERAKRDREEAARRRRDFWWRTGFAAGVVVVVAIGVLMVSLTLQVVTLTQQGDRQRAAVIDGFEQSKQDNVDGNIVIVQCATDRRNRTPEEFERCVRTRLADPISPKGQP